MDYIVEFFAELSKIVSNTAILNNTLLFIFLFIFVVMIIRESNNPKSPLDWRNLLIDSKTGKMSLGKAGQFIGIVISNWAIIYLIQLVKADQVTSVLVWLFPLWLGFLGGTWGYDQFLKTKAIKDAPTEIPEPSEAKSDK